MKRLPVVPHLTPEELQDRYRSCEDAAEMSRWHLVWLVSRPAAPLSATEAAGLVGYTPAWGRELLKRYNARGPEALADGRRGNGAKPLLSYERQAALGEALGGDPPGGGLWTGPEVAKYVRDRRGVEVCPQTGWQWPKDLGFALRVPRPRHPSAATADQQRVWL